MQGHMKTASSFGILKLLLYFGNKKKYLCDICTNTLSEYECRVSSRMILTAFVFVAQRKPWRLRKTGRHLQAGSAGNSNCETSNCVAGNAKSSFFPPTRRPNALGALLSVFVRGLLKSFDESSEHILSMQTVLLVHIREA